MSKPTSLSLVGDVSFGDCYACSSIGINSYLARNSDCDFFSEVKQLFQLSTLVFGNLETVLSEVGLEPRCLQSMHMRGSPTAVQMLAAAGFNVLNVANNHMLQHGAAAFRETIELLRNHQIGVVGLACPNGRNCVPFRTQIGNQEIVFLGYGFEKDKYYTHTSLYAQGDAETVIDDIKSCKTSNNVVVCSFHWGREYLAYPSPQQIQLAHQSIDAGCDLIIGHHPHVLNGYEVWHGGLIFYSTGNFLFDQLWNPLCREGCIIQLNLRDSQFKLERAWITEIGSDFQVRLSGDPRTAERRFAQLNHELAATHSIRGAAYEKDQTRAEKHNRYASWLFLAKNFWRYEKQLLWQILADTGRKKFLP